MDGLLEMIYKTVIYLEEIKFGSPQQMLKALKKLPGLEDYDKDGGQIFNSTIHLIDVACKRACSLVSEQHENFTNIHLFIKRFQALKEEQKLFWKTEKTIMNPVD